MDGMRERKQATTMEMSKCNGAMRHVQTVGCSAIMPVLLSLSSEANWTPTGLGRSPAPLSVLYTDNVMGPIWNTKGRNRLMDLSEIVTACQNKSMGENAGVRDAVFAAVAGFALHRVASPSCRTRLVCFSFSLSCSVILSLSLSLTAKLLANAEARRSIGYRGIVA